MKYQNAIFTQIERRIKNNTRILFIERNHNQNQSIHAKNRVNFTRHVSIFHQIFISSKRRKRILNY